MSKIAGVEDECRRRWQRIDLVDGCSQRSDDVSIRGLVESDVAVTDLYEAEVTFQRVMRRVFKVAKRERLYNAALNNQQCSGACPGHAFQESAAVNAVVVMGLLDVV